MLFSAEEFREIEIRHPVNAQGCCCVAAFRKHVGDDDAVDSGVLHFIYAEVEHRLTACSVAGVLDTASVLIGLCSGLATTDGRPLALDDEKVPAPVRLIAAEDVDLEVRPPPAASIGRSRQAYLPADRVKALLPQELEDQTLRGSLQRY